MEIPKVSQRTAPRHDDVDDDDDHDHDHDNAGAATTAAATTATARIAQGFGLNGFL